MGLLTQLEVHITQIKLKMFLFGEFGTVGVVARWLKTNIFLQKHKVIHKILASWLSK